LFLVGAFQLFSGTKKCSLAAEPLAALTLRGVTESQRCATFI
jgi:hypothetical protein